MKHLVFDLETTAIDRTDPRSLPGTIHCIVAQDVGTDEMWSFGPDRIKEGVDFLASADRLIGHNIAGFDLPVIQHVFPGWETEAEVWDTLLASRLIFASNLYERGIKARNAAGRCKRGRRAECGNCPGCVAREVRLPRKFLKAHGLEAWGRRLGEHKTSLGKANDWSTFSDAMLEYCQQDVRLNMKLYRYLKSSPAERDWPLCSDRSIINESMCGYIISLQERNGVGFDVEAARELEAKLTLRRAELLEELREFFPDWQRVKKSFIPKRTATYTKGRDVPLTLTKGVRHTVYEMARFNPDSKHDIADRLQKVYGWKPRDFTAKTNDPIVDEKTLSSLAYPPIPALVEYMVVAKRLGQLADGRQGWLKHVKGGRIHGRVHVTGTRTSRMAHFSPNLGQVPKVKSPYGVECRALFGPARKDWLMVGCDAERLELMMLAHRLARFDGGEFGRQLVEGDPHSEWQKATGIFYRDNQKTFTYAMLYGAGFKKLGYILIEDWWEAFRAGLTKKQPPKLRQAANLGKARKSRLLRMVPSLDALLKACARAWEKRYVVALDGRVLGCKSDYGVLNDVLQSDGEIVMKHALVLAHRRLVKKYGPHGFRWAYLLNVHDEAQFEADPEIAEGVGQLFAQAITDAAAELKVRVPVSGAYKVGRNWSETH